jgi:DNA polymerase I-like protein with 3'-5' exonuclease and polymerase domains
MLAHQPKAQKLFHDGALALAIVEGNGIRMDMGYLNRTIKETDIQIAELTVGLNDCAVGRKWGKMYGRRLNFDSPVQLGKVLFEGMGYDPPGLTKGKHYKVDEESLGKLDIPFVKDFLEIKKLQKIQSTYLRGIKREVVNGILHPFQNLHIARTFRSSSSNPNFQNLPVRDPVLGRLVRQAFIAREGRHIVELDYSGIEVGIAACYHKDPMMLSYINDKTKDMHRDMAQECYKLPKEEMTNPVNDKDKKRIKQIRYCGKNMFVFPQFYGDWYIENAKALWDAARRMKLKTRDGGSMRAHLKSVGIKELGDLDPRRKPRQGTFEKHLQAVEKSFWTERFPVYDQWKKDWVKLYEKRGYLLTKTGFICQGHMKKNEIINYPVQGSAFHCLLQSLIWLQKEITKRGMKTLIIGQIHDSIVADVPAEELEDFLELANYIMTVRLPEAWDWINVPLEIEAEVAPLGGSWADKKERAL